jgi:hypothetical protein
MFEKKHRSLFRDLRDSVTDSKTSSLADVLRKAKLLASALGNEEFKQWIDFELKGYPSNQDVPDYRRLNIPSVGTFSGPFRMLENYVLPTFNLPPEVKYHIEYAIFPNSVKEIEEWAKTTGLKRQWPTELVLLSASSLKMADGSVLIEAHQPLSKANLEGILDAVRTRLIDFLIKLQEMDSTIVDSEDAIPKLDKDQVAQTFNFTIQGDHNVVAAGQTVSQNVQQIIKPFDEASLMKYFREELKISREDLEELSGALKEDGTSKDKKLGPKVEGWMGKMVRKSIQGLWDVSIRTAPLLIYHALSAYYSWQ